MVHSTSAATQRIDEDWLRHHPLPQPGADSDKERRGHVLVVGGSPQIPGAILLAATAALRAGAGKLVVATCEQVAPLLATALPEARVIALPQTADGALAVAGVDDLAELTDIDALLVGPGMQHEATTVAFAQRLLAATACPAVLDAYAMGAIPSASRPHTVVTPHAGEMAHLSGLSKDEVLQRPCEIATAAAKDWQATVVLKGAASWIAAPDHHAWLHVGGNAGLGVSGSGDVLAGCIVGLLARGLPPLHASAWGVALHARAGELLAQRIGPLGYLAREIADALPQVMARYG